MLQYANINIHAQNQNVLTATGDALDDIRKGYGLPVVLPSGSTGKVVVTVTGGGSISISDGTQATLPNGKRIQVSGTHTSVSDQDEVSVAAIDTGDDTNLGAGQIVRFVSPPLNLETNARVSANQPLTGGRDTEDDERKRERILNRLGNPPLGGNWSHKIEVALNALASVQMAFVYPALGGPASERIVPVKDINPEQGDFSRVLSTDAMEIIRSAMQEEFGADDETVVEPPVEETTDVALSITIPDSSASGGDGTGWQNSTIWPPLDGGDTRVEVSVVTANNDITVNASTSTAPVANVTRIALWKSTDQKFFPRLVTAVSGSSGAWRLTLDRPVVDSQGNGPAVNDFVSPDAVHIESYGRTWREVMRRLGPGENTSDGNRLPRSLLHPYPTRSLQLNSGVSVGRWLSDLTIKQLEDMSDAHAEITDIAWSYRSVTTPTVPGSVATAARILVPGQFGVYPI